MILADKRDYKIGYRKHYSAYKVLAAENGAVLSRRLLLVYSVECGLKYKLLNEKWQINTLNEIKDIISDKTHPRHQVLGTHNLQKIIKELGQEGRFHFPQIRTVHNDPVEIEQYHQVQRYGIREANGCSEKQNEIETVLKEIAEWIGENI